MTMEDVNQIERNKVLDAQAAADKKAYEDKQAELRKKEAEAAVEEPSAEAEEKKEEAPAEPTPE